MQKMKLGGRFKVKHFDKNGKLIDVYEFPNGIVDAGLNSLLDVVFDGETQINPWYVGLIDNAGFSSLSNSDTMGSHAGWSEFTDYAEASRPEWDVGAAAGRSITNGTAIDFSINASGTVRGIFVTGTNTKGGSTGTLWSTALFASNIAVSNGDTLKVTYTVSG